MIINGKTLLDMAPIKNMEPSKKVFNGRSYGLAEVGYDIRLKQTIKYIPQRIMKNTNSEKTYIRPSLISVDTNNTSGNFCLASAIEEFDMPPNLMGVVHDKSTNIREGIQVFNTVIEPGWKGFLTLEIAFHGNKSITLEAGTPIAQVVFHEILNPMKYEGKYQNQKDMPVEAILENN